MSFTWRRTHTVVAAVVAVALVAGGLALAAGRGTPDAQPPPAASTTPSASSTAGTRTTATPRPVDPLTGGRPHDAPVIAAKVENIGLARPQVGLHAADIVFAQEVEGAQTRLVAVYHTRFPKRLGPVRSARSTDVQLLPLFGRPGLVYSGANARVQRRIDRASIVPIYRETRDRRRAAPHNVFVNLASIARSYETKLPRARSIGWTFAERSRQASAAPEAARATSRVGHDTFRFDYRGGRYTVRWNGKTYADGDSGTTTRCDNVVVMRVHNHPDGNRDVAGSASVQSDTVGRGKVSVYRDGHRVDGTWRRSSPGSPMRLTDRHGRPIALAPGQTWVTLQG